MLKFAHSGMILCAVLAIMLVSPALFAQKLAKTKQELEIRPLETEAAYRFQNKRVSKESGAPVALYQLNYAVKAAAPEAMARQYLRENQPALKIRNEALELRHSGTVETPGGFHVRYHQVMDGYPVYESEVLVNLDRKNRVTMVMNGYKPMLRLNGSSPKISLENAHQIAKDYLGLSFTPIYEAKETVVYYSNGNTRLAHKILMSVTEEPRGDWEILVDAQTGEIFKAVDRLLYWNSDRNGGNHTKASGSGWVFDPDPLTRAGATYQANGMFGDNNDADTDSLTAQLISVILNDITFKDSDSLYHLEGPYAEILDYDSPMKGEFSQPSDTFFFTRGDDAFEAVNIYYHLDKNMRYINETLGFPLMPYQYSGGVKADPHGWSGADQSTYSSFLGRLSFGEGGVDDGEDEDVILHELGHGLHNWLIQGNVSLVNGLSEGCGDYWAASYKRSLGYWQPSDPQYNWTFIWDGHNQYWGGRILNYNAQYPGGLVNQIHTDGQMWASTLMNIWNEIGREATDLNFLEGLSMTNGSSSQEDAAQAFIQADINLFDGAHLNVIQFWFEQRGYNVSVPVPDIVHTPLGDTEDLDGPYTIQAGVTATGPIESVLLFYGTDSVFSDTLEMAADGNIFTAAIPGSGGPATYNYYIMAADSNGLAATSPATAPQEFYAFTAETDTIGPVVLHSPLGNQAYQSWPSGIGATISDNIGILSARVEYFTNNNGPGGGFDLVNVAGNNYFAAFDIDTTHISLGDSVYYRIIADDASAAANQTILPDSGYFGFMLIEARGLILIIDDDPTANKQVVGTEKGDFYRDSRQHKAGASGNAMQSILEEAGFIAVMESVTDTDPDTWEQYDLLISSSGYNEDPVTDGDYRNALENWVSNPAHKLLIEGGEVGYDAAAAPGYPSFAANVLHTSTWDDDNGGPLRLVSTFAAHPMVNMPHILPDRLFIVYSGWSSQDMMNTINGAYTIYDSQNKPGYSGITIYDDNNNIGSAQSVFYAFNFAELSDSLDARHLLENTVNYLLATETPNTAPSNFSLQAPVNGDTLAMADSIRFAWNLPEDLEENPLNYTLHIIDGRTSVSISEIQDTTYLLTGAEFEPEREYIWTVEVSDGELSTVSSDTFAFITPPVVGITDLQTGLPTAFALHQNYPNPFNPTTSIHYDLEQSGSVSLKIFNILGQEVRTLVNGRQTTGFKKVVWDGRNNLGELLGSGVYIYRLDVTGVGQRYVQNRKMVLMK